MSGLDFVSSQPAKPLAVGGPMCCACGGHTGVVVQVYTLGRGVTIKGQGADLGCAEGTFELEGNRATLAFEPASAAKTQWTVLTVEGYIDAVGLQFETVDQEYVSEGCGVFEHGSVQSKTAIVSLPPATGKTTIAHSLATRLGCKYIVEEWAPGQPLLANALHLTNADMQGGAA